MLSKVEINILKSLLEDGITNQMKSKTIKNISEKTGLSYARVRDNIKHLLSLNCVELGFKEKSSYTYFLTKEGQRKIPNSGDKS